MTHATTGLLLSGLLMLVVSPLDYLRNEATFRHREGVERYAREDYAGAAESFDAARAEDAQALELAFDAAAARYKAGDYAGALEALEAVRGAAAPPDRANLQERAHFNAGNAHFKRAEYEQAIGAYDQALALDPDDEDAAFNKKLAEEALKRQQQQQQDEQQQEQQQSDEDSEESSSGGEGEESDQEQSESDEQSPGQGEQQQNESQPSDGDQQGGQSGDDQRSDDEPNEGGSEPEGGQESQQPQRQPFANPAMPPPPAGQQYEPLNERDVDRLLDQLERRERGLRGQFNPRGELERPNPFRWSDDEAFLRDPFAMPFDEQPPSRSGRKDW